MNKPYIVCHMMASVDGRIDCAMTEQLPGVQEYYATLDALEAPTRVSGRVTAELEMARPGAFQSERHTPLGRTAFSKAAEAEGYEVVVDTHGTLLWDSVPEGERPLLILTSEQVSREYLAYLDRSRISWIACGAERIDLPLCLRHSGAGLRRKAHGGGGRRPRQRRISGGRPAGRGQRAGGRRCGRPGRPACGVRRTACPAPGDASDAYRRQDL